MSPEAVEACARRIEELEADVLRWRYAYTKLASSRFAGIRTALRYERPVTLKRILGKINVRLQREW